MRRKRILRIGLALALLAGLALAAALATLRSGWFYEKVRARVVETVETATGGRAELGGFRFDWRRLRVEVQSFTLHGTEPAGKPPLFHASSIAAGLKIVSVFRRDVDIQYLEVAEPRVNLIVYPDGRTNFPEPKVKKGGNTLDDIVNLAIGRFDLRGGVFGVESRGATPFEARGQNLAVRLGYERRGPRYRGTLAIQPLDLRVGEKIRAPLAVDLGVVLEKNRIGVTFGKVATGGTSVEFSGWLDDLNSPRASFQYDARVSLADASRLLEVPELKRGEAQVSGSGSWSAAAGLAATGALRSSGVEYRDSTILLRNGSLGGALTATAGAIDVTGARIAATYFSSRGQAPVEGRIADIAIRDRLLELRGVALAAMGGSFDGEGRLRDWKHYTITGEIGAFDARRVVALYSPAPLPWDGLGGGPIRVDGTLGNAKALRAKADLTVSPAAGSAPVHGHLTADFDGSAGTVDLGRSTLTLPHSRAEFNGVYGRELRAHLETADLNDLLPLLGQNAGTLPIRLEGGSAVFDGTITGDLAAPHFAGRLTAKSFTVDARPVDSLEGDVTASPENVHLENATARHGGLNARLDAQIALHEWEADDASQIFGNVSLDNAPMADLLAAADLKDVPATGSLAASAKFSGTVGKPIVKGEVSVVKGSFQEEPFDRFTGGLAYADNTAELTASQITAGEKQAQLMAAWRHTPGDLASGRLYFQVNSNVMPLAAIVIVQKARPGAKGTVQIAANGELEIGKTARVMALHADVAGRSLALTGQPIGDAHLTANSQGQSLRTQLEASFANSAVHGDGTWRLEGDYPGTATITFSRLDFAQLREWIAPTESGAANFAGFAEGEMRIEGPALKPDQMRAELRLPKVEIGPPRSAGLPGNLTLHNAAPIVASVANSVLTVQSARLTGKATDVTIGGRIQLKNDKSPLDLKASGRIDLAIVEEFNRDFVATGLLVIDAGLRGSPDDPQLTGRMQVLNASMTIVDFPNGVTNANGSVLFSGNRATIEKLGGETGGGKVEVSGFVSYQGEQLVFQLRADAKQVRVRYPEGVSTVANAALRLEGTSDRSTLGGTITILRTGFNPQSDFSSVIATSAEPVRTPPARTGLIGGVNFDVQIETAPDIQVQSSLTQDVQVEANLRLRGNASNPALIGRVNITQGQVFFYGTRYTINQGSISFYNPLKIDPIFDVDLETKARGIDITLTVSGPLNKLNLTPRSDPPLQFNEIVALLATGRTPTSDPTLLAQQATAPQSWQQMGASTLLGQAIANPVAGRLQRFFGVSKLRIDPTLPGVENNPQARLTLEQQVTPDITLTYVTNVTNSNPQVVRIEWSFSRQWSVVALREENGVYSLDFLYKKRF